MGAVENIRSIAKASIARARLVVASHKKYYVVYVNIVLILAFSYFMIAPPLVNMLPPDEASSVSILLGTAMTFSLLGFVYPLFGTISGTLKRPTSFMLGGFVVKLCICMVLHVAGFFPGMNNFVTDYEYGRQYLEIEILNQAGTPSAFYYPPACSLFFVFLYLTNPWKSSLVFCLQMLVFDLGITYMIWKIASMKQLVKNASRAPNALFFYLFSGIQVILVMMYQKFDLFVIFLSLAGIYHVFEEKWFKSAVFLVTSGFFKIYTFLWIAGVLLMLVKQKRWVAVKKLLVSVLVAGISLAGLFYMIEGLQFFTQLFSFGWHFTIWEEAYNLNWGYYLKYLDVPFLNFLPPALIIVALVYFIMFRARNIDVPFFIQITMILLLIYPSVNYSYMIWSIPLIGLDLTRNVNGYRKALLSYDLIHVNIDLHAFTWVVIVGLTSSIYVKNVSDFGVVIVLIVRFIIIVFMIVGTISYLRAAGGSSMLEKGGTSGRDPAG